MPPLHFEDLHPGQTFTTAALVMAEPDLVAFATEFDPQPMHVDPAWAAHGPFGGLIASGWQTAFVALRLQHETGLPGVGLAEIESLAWPMPVRPGDEVRAEIEIRACEPADADHGLVRFQNTMRNEGGATVQIMLGAVLVPRRSMQPE